jgi:hypothetical protein
MGRTKPILAKRLRLGGPRGFAYSPAPRCPSCDSLDLSPRLALIDEKDTFAVRPQDVSDDRRIARRRYRYQEYRYFQCNDCWLTWFVEPTGRWSTRSNRLTSEPHTTRPLWLVDEHRYPIRERLDFARSERRRTGRFSRFALAPQIVASPVVILTGAGASVPFGFGAARGYRFPDAERLTLDRMVLQNLMATGSVLRSLRQHRSGRQLLVLADRYPEDMEILLEVLLRLQQMILHEGSDRAFSRALHRNGFTCVSWFVFDETAGGDEVRPPLTRAVTSGAFKEALEGSEYFREVRTLLESVCFSILTTYGPPDRKGADLARRLLHPLLSRVRAMLSSPLPFFTTNFDQVVEITLAHEGEHLYDGFAREPSSELRVRDRSGAADIVHVPLYEYQPAVFDESASGDVCLFHLHGSSQHFVEAESGALYQTSATAVELRALHGYAWASGRLTPGAIVPATCKDRYLFTNPFALAYDYLSAVMHRARACVIIGQSGRDYVIKQVVRAAADSNADLRFLVIDYRESLPLHLSDALPRERVDFWGRGLNEAAVDWIVDHVRRLL